MKKITVLNLDNIPKDKYNKAIRYLAKNMKLLVASECDHAIRNVLDTTYNREIQSGHTFNVTFTLRVLGELIIEAIDMQE